MNYNIYISCILLVSITIFFYFVLVLLWKILFWSLLRLKGLSNHDNNGNNVTKIIGFMRKTAALHKHHTF